ncbi:MAG: protease modulator HflC [Pontibacterium sp.]
MKPSSTFIVVIAAALAIIGMKSVYVVNETERGVLLKFGEIVNPDIEPGLHFKLPFVNQVRIFDGRMLTLDATPQSYLTLEKKTLIVDSFVKWRIDNVGKFYTATSGEERRAAQLLSDRVDTGLRNEFGSRTVTEVVSGEREELIQNLTSSLSKIAQEEFGIVVTDVRVKRIELPPDVSDSVYARMRTEREREARELRSRGKELAEGIRADADRQKTVIVAEAFRESELIRGEGDARATSIYADAYSRNAEFFSFHRSLQAYRESFATGGNMMVLEPDSDFFKYLAEPNAR